MLHIAFLMTLAMAGQGPREAQAIDPGSWVTNDDYPAAAIEAGQAGITSFRLDIAKDGTVSRCTVTGSSGSPLLDTTACMLLQMRARFHPALDKRGRPVTDTYSARFRWVLPEPEVDAPGYVITTIKVAADGTITDCSTKKGGAFETAASDMDCDKLSNTEAPVVSGLASEYEILRFVISVSSEEEVFSFDATGSERTILHMAGEIQTTAEGRPLRCVTLTKTEGAWDFCDTFWRQLKRGSKDGERGVKKVTIRRILYGTPRETAKPI